MNDFPLVKTLLKGGEHNSHRPEYTAWRNMLQRCFNFDNPRFGDYGGRGITVCYRWFDFENFYSDMGEKEFSWLSFDRINNNGNYEPGNCIWADKTDQAYNRRKAKRITKIKLRTRPACLWHQGHRKRTFEAFLAKLEEQEANDWSLPDDEFGNILKG